MSPFLSPQRWQDAIAAHKDLLPIDRFICLKLWEDRGSDGLVQARQKTLAASIGISTRHLRDRMAELERRGIIQRLGSDNGGTTIALTGGSVIDEETTPIAPIDDVTPPYSRERRSNSAHIEKPPQQDRLRPQSSGPRPAAQFRPPEEYKNITPTLEPIISNCVPVPTKLKSPPSPLLVTPSAMNGSDLLGLPLADDEDALLREAIETWHHWQKKAGRKARMISLTASRRRRFANLWRGPLRRSMTAWRKICRACTRNALLAGAEGRWDGATFDWVQLEDNAARILRGEFAEDYDPAVVVTA